MPQFNFRKQFPIFSRRIYGHPLAYLDSAATSQKPTAVVAAMDAFYRRHCANPRRGMYQLGVEATEAVERTRRDVAAFIGAAGADEVVFTSGTTGAINLVSGTWGNTLKPGDVILLSELEHHSNLLPWQALAKRRRLRLQFIPIDRNGQLDVRSLGHLLKRRVKLVAVTAVSNALGTRVNLSRIIQQAHGVGARVLVDAAQAVAHDSINVQKLGCDFLAFSAHKMYGPMGVGVLWGKRELLSAMPPFLFGGEMVAEVGWRHATFADPPTRFEAGTQNAAGIVGLGAAIRFLEKIGFPKIRQHEERLVAYALRRLRVVPGVTVYGPRILSERGAVVSFNISGIHPHDVASVLDEVGIAVRAGHHCAMPLMSRLGVPATVRASFGIYNSTADVDRLIKGIKKVQQVFR